MISGCIYRRAVNAASRYDGVKEMGCGFPALVTLPRLETEEHRCVWAPRGLIISWQPHPLKVPCCYVFPGSNTKKWFRWWDWLTKNGQRACTMTCYRRISTYGRFNCQQAPCGQVNGCQEGRRCCRGSSCWHFQSPAHRHIQTYKLSVHLEER